MTPKLSRRSILAGSVAAAAGTHLAPVFAQTPATGWTWTDVRGETLNLPEVPQRIAANLVTAAVLWDLGIKPVAVFDWTATAYPDGDHIAWGNIDVAEITIVNNPEGNIIPEDLIATNPDVVMTQTFDVADPASTNAIPVDIYDVVEQIAPILIVTDMSPTDQQLERLVALGTSLGANPDDPGIVEQREAYEAKLEEFTQVLAEKADLTCVFINIDPAEIYVGGPEGVAELTWLQSLGMNFANAESELAGDFWEQLSVEQAQLYPADVVFSDVYSSLLTAEELQTVPVFASMPAVAADQVGLWQRDFPPSYLGMTNFLETLLVTLRTAEKVI